MNFSVVGCVELLMDSVMVGCRLLFCVSCCCLVVLDEFFGGCL